MDAMREAFFRRCRRAIPADEWYVSLYRVTPFYGGPEEGGWWGEDVHLVAAQLASTKTQARQLRRQVLALAKRLDRESAREYGDRCLAESEWLDSRGLDDSFLPEVDGPTRHAVYVERRPGQHNSRGNREWS